MYKPNDWGRVFIDVIIIAILAIGMSIASAMEHDVLIKRVEMAEERVAIVEENMKALLNDYYIEYDKEG